MSRPNKTAAKGKALIKKFEGLKLSAYLCPAGIPTIGWGHTKGVKMGDKISEYQAEEYLNEDIAPIEKVLNSKNYDITQNQYDALVSMLYNIGTGRLTNFDADLKNKNFEAVTARMAKYVYANGKLLNGLVNRRNEEIKLFNS